MRIAIPHWQGRISPVFDVAVNFLLIEVEDGRESRREERRLSATDSFARVAEFLSFGAGILICGAISAPAEARLVAAGVQVIGFTCGRVDDVLNAYLNGELVNRVFAMPGCQRWRRRTTPANTTAFTGDPEGEDVMPRGFGMGFGMGAGRGGGGRGQGRGQGQCRAQGLGAGRMGGPMAGGPGGFCVCPKCGEKTPHGTGQPCLQISCPKCGGPMTRA